MKENPFNPCVTRGYDRWEGQVPRTLAQQVWAWPGPTHPHHGTLMECASSLALYPSGLARVAQPAALLRGLPGQGFGFVPLTSDAV